MASKDFVVRNGLQVNGSITLSGNAGSAGDILTSGGSGSAAYWVTPSVLTVDQTLQYTWINTHTFSNTVFLNAVSANGTLGTSGQILTSNGSDTYWSTPSVLTVDQTLQYTWTNTHTFSNTVFLNAVSANGGLGTAGQVLTSNGSDTYWSTVSGGGGGTSINLSANNTDLSTYYFPLSNAASGTWSNGVIANQKLYFVPATGTLSATIFNSLSDLEYKTDVQPINNAINILKQLDGVSFKWKDTGHKSYGVIAQEIEKVLPEIVDINNDIKSVNYQALIGFLIEAVKELSDKVEKLENAK